MNKRKIVLALCAIFCMSNLYAVRSGSYQVKQRSCSGDMGYACGQAIAQYYENQRQLEYQKQILIMQYQMQLQYERESESQCDISYRQKKVEIESKKYLESLDR